MDHRAKLRTQVRFRSTTRKLSLPTDFQSKRWVVRARLVRVREKMGRSRKEARMNGAGMNRTKDPLPLPASLLQSTTLSPNRSSTTPISTTLNSNSRLLHLRQSRQTLPLLLSLWTCLRLSNLPSNLKSEPSPSRLQVMSNPSRLPHPHLYPSIRSSKFSSQPFHKLCPALPLPSPRRSRLPEAEVGRRRKGSNRFNPLFGSQIAFRYRLQTRALSVPDDKPNIIFIPHHSFRLYHRIHISRLPTWIKST